MKNKAATYLRVAWHILTEVPGWPDAPARARAARALPVVTPILGILALLTWNFGYFSPRVAANRASLQPLIQLEQDISTLQLATSEEQSNELNQRAQTASRLLVDSPQDLSALLKEYKKSIQDRGWEVTFQTSEASDEAPASPDGTAQIAFLQVRAKFKPVTANTDRFTSIVGVLDQLSSSVKRIDLTRVAIRADESRWQPVEATLRLASPISHAKTP